MARSESNIISKTSYADYNMTHYPERVDSRSSTDSGYNENMKGFENRKDYNIAEHVNALADAVMVMQRVLGINPQGGSTDVNNRIGTLENRDYDSRYGGVGWSPAQTLVGHTHNGEAGGPGQISLTSEVSGQLPKGSLNLAYTSSSGLTGSDLAISNNNGTKISAAVSDKLSVTQGGTIEKDLKVKGRLTSRFSVEVFPAQAVAGKGSLVADNRTATGESLKLTNETSSYRFVRHEDYDLQYGRYVAILRVKSTNSTAGENLVKMEAYNYTGRWQRRAYKIIQASDFDNTSEYQTFYMVFDHYGDGSSNRLHFNIWKYNTSTNYDIYFDYLHITPVHPAVYDM